MMHPGTRRGPRASPGRAHAARASRTTVASDMIQQVLTIVRNTFLESIRQPIFVVLLLTSALALFFLPMLSLNTFDDDNMLLIDMGLSTLALSGLFLAAFTATGVLSAELENKTVLTVVSKPVPRPAFVLGKYLGVSLALLTWYWIAAIIFFLTIRHRVMSTASDEFDQPVLTFGVVGFFAALGLAAMANYWYHRVFTSSLVLSMVVLLTLAAGLVLIVNKQWQFQSPLTEWEPDKALAGGQRVIALVMIFESILIVTAAAIAASTRLGQVMTLLVCIALVLLGNASQSTFGATAEKQSWQNVHGLGGFAAWLWPHLGYRLVPNLQVLWPGQALIQGHDIPLAHLALVSVYSLLYIGALIFLAMALFQRREVG
jgi:hypothetical protein